MTNTPSLLSILINFFFLPFPLHLLIPLLSVPLPLFPFLLLLYHLVLFFLYHSLLFSFVTLLFSSLRIFSYSSLSLSSSLLLYQPLLLFFFITFCFSSLSLSSFFSFIILFFSSLLSSFPSSLSLSPYLLFYYPLLFFFFITSVLLLLFSLLSLLLLPGVIIKRVHYFCLQLLHNRLLPFFIILCLSNLTCSNAKLSFFNVFLYLITSILILISYYFKWMYFTKFECPTIDRPDLAKF